MYSNWKLNFPYYRDKNHVQTIFIYIFIYKNRQLFSKFKLIGDDELNNLIIILTLTLMYKIKLPLKKLGPILKIFN